MREKQYFDFFCAVRNLAKFSKMIEASTKFKMDKR